jgi:hypothetical protein
VTTGEHNPNNTARELDEFDLELMLAGAPTEPDLAKRLATDPTLGPARDELAAMQQWWAQNRPPLAEAPRAAPRSSRAPLRWAMGGLAAAAALLLVVSMPTPEPSTPRPGFIIGRGSGDIAVDVEHTRAGQPVDGAYAAGDQLALSFVSNEPGFASVYTVQDNGSVSVLTVGARVDPAAAFRLGPIALDGYAGREWLVVDVTDAPRTADEVRETAQAELPKPHGDEDQWVSEITRGNHR